MRKFEIKRMALTSTNVHENYSTYEEKERMKLRKKKLLSHIEIIRRGRRK